MIFAVFDPSTFTVCKTPVFKIYICCFITSFDYAILSFYTCLNIKCFLENEHKASGM